MASNNTPNLTFGPILSRRFGMSLGIDLSSTIKQCNFDCLYCELEPAKTISQQSVSPSLKDLISQIKKALEKHSNIDVITITANGEPTLYPYLDQLIDELDKIKGSSKTLILSNGGTIYNKNIQNTLSKLDIVKLSLDCVSKECFKKLDRINSSVDTENIVNGMVEFRKIYNKDLIIEVLFVEGINDNDKEIKLLNTALQKIRPNRIDISTIDRPPAYDVKPISFQKLEKIAKCFTNLLVNITCKKRSKLTTKSIHTFDESEILRVLKSRPLTQEDVQNTFCDDSKEILAKLIENGKIKKSEVLGVQFYIF